jgi:nicotinamide-nucleotide amidase
MAEALSPILPAATERLVHQVLAEACRRNLRLATAESCTGGLLASLLTDLPGCSHAFERGFVVYTNAAKAGLLGVDPDLLEDPGPVSEPVARAMAAGALARSQADIVAAITGWMEQGPGPDQPAGRVWFAAARRSGEAAVQRAEFGNAGRAALRLACLDVALRLLMDQIAQA